MKKNFLAGLTAAQFLRRYWQKKPLLARNALERYSAAFTREQLFELASRTDLESRLVTHGRRRWQVRHGPFSGRELRRLPRSGWTLLVQGAELALGQAERLLREFAFIPYARLDDLMVSYAAPGGGVGPHFDSYDVFLVQAHGERRWRVSAQRNLDLVPEAPLKILKAFTPEREWTLSPGDVLYLPPRYAHDGVAVGECITCSVGFRAPAAQELASGFLDFLQDGLAVSGEYADPDLEPTRRPARIPARMVKHSAEIMDRLRWSRADVAKFLGRYLTEPREHVLFERPARALRMRDFVRHARHRGVHLAPATRMLFHGRSLFINGEAHKPAQATARILTRLADERALQPPFQSAAETRELLYAWYLAGYIALGAVGQTNG